MKKLLIIITILLSSSWINHSSTQLPSLKTKVFLNTFEGNKGSNYLVRGVSQDEFLIVGRNRSGNEHILTLVDAERMNVLKRFKARHVNLKKGSPTHRYYVNQDQIINIYGFYNKSSNKYNVYGKIYNKSGKLIKRERLLYSYTAKKRRQVGQISVVASEDKSKFMLYRNPPDGRFEDEVLTLTLLDNDLEEIYDRKFEVSKESYLADLISVDVTNKGEALIVIQEFQFTNNRKNKRVLGKSEFKFFKLDKESDALDEIKIKNTEAKIYSAYVEINEKTNTAILTGMYNELQTTGSSRSRRRASYGFNGVYLVSIDFKEWEISSEKFSNIPSSTLKEMATVNVRERAKERKKSKLKDNISLGSYRLHDVLLRKDGKITIVLEKSYMIENCTTNPNTGVTTCTYTYYDMEIVQFDLDKDGELLNTYIIPKSQISRSSYYHGFKLIQNEEGELNYIFNDAFNNYNPKKQSSVRDPFKYTFTSTQGYFTKPKNLIAMVTIEPEKGKLVKKFITKEKKGIWLIPRSGIILNDKTIISPTRQKKAKGLVISSLFFD